MDGDLGVSPYSRAVRSKLKVKSLLRSHAWALIWLASVLVFSRVRVYRTDVLVPPPPLPCQKDCERLLQVRECGGPPAAVGQTFRVPQTGSVARVVVWMSRRNQGPAHGEIVLRVLDEPAGQELRQAVMRAEPVGREGGAYAFTFPPLPVMEGQTHYLSLERAGDPWNPGSPLLVRYEIEGLHYEAGEMYLGGQKAFGGDVAVAVQSLVDLPEFLRSPGGMPELQLWGTALLSFLAVPWRRAFLSAAGLWLLLAFNQMISVL